MSSYLVEYYEKCKSGEIRIGRELMTQLEMLMDDMKNPLYQFDTAEAHKRIRFIEQECKHSISPFAGKPFLLQLHQKAFRKLYLGFTWKLRGNG